MTSMPVKRQISDQAGFGLTALLFIASGFSSLAYQVVWTRMLVLVFGSTTFATATVLSVFMGGLALGSYVCGRFSDKVKRPFLCYGILEAVIGLWALIVPFLFSAAVPLYRTVWQQMHPDLLPFSLLRFFMAFAILIVPTACMGATLPLLCRFVTASLDTVGKRVGTLYAANTFGAVAGSVLAGFALLPAVGMTSTTLLAALINFILCGLVVFLAPKLERVSSKDDTDQPGDITGDLAVEAVSATDSQASPRQATAPSIDWLTGLAIFSFGVSGAVAMIYEVGWTRTLLMVIGSSTYAFTIMLSTFLIGIFVGSLLCARYIDRARNPLVWFAGLEICVCLSGLLSMVLFNYLPWWNLQLNSFFPQDPITTLGTRFALSYLILFPLTFCLGAIFPAIVKATTHELNAVGKSVGTLYSVNTLGAIVGAFAAGFVLVPWLGVELTLVAAAAVNLVLGLALLLLMKSVRPFVKVVTALVSLPVFAACVQMPDLWERSVMLTAQGERRHLVQGVIPYKSYEDWVKWLHDSVDCLYWKDGASSTVGVVFWKRSGHRSLVTNGHVDASDGSDKPTQFLLGAYPLFWKPDAKDVAVVGWGSGMTLGAVSLFPVSSITAIELEPAVPEASHFFHHINHSPEKDPRVHLEVNDGRNYLLATDKKFDVIISEPSNPWQAGVCNLFTREYFQVCRDRMNPGGVFALWLQTVEIPPENLKEILTGLNMVFGNTQAMRADGGNLVVLASDKPLTVDYARLRAAFNNKALKSELKEGGIESPLAVLSRISAASDGMNSLTAGAMPNADDSNRLEYAIGRTYENVVFQFENREMMERYMGSPWKGISFGDMPEGKQSILLGEVGRQALLDGRDDLALNWAGASLAVATNIEGFRVAGMALWQQGNRGDAYKMWDQALKISPNSVTTLRTRGLYNLGAGRVAQARDDFNKVLELQPGNHIAQFELAETYSSLLPGPVSNQSTRLFFPNPSRDQSPAVVIKYLQPLKDDKEMLDKHADMLLLLGQAEYEMGNLKEAETDLRNYLKIQPRSVAGQRVLGSILEGRGNLAEASAWWFKSFNQAKSAESMLWKRANESLKEGREVEAVHLMAECVQLWPDEPQVYSMLAAQAEKYDEARKAIAVMKIAELDGSDNSDD